MDSRFYMIKNLNKFIPFAEVIYEISFSILWTHMIKDFCPRIIYDSKKNGDYLNAHQ